MSGWCCYREYLFCVWWCDGAVFGWGCYRECGVTSSSDDENEQQQQLTHGVFKAVHVGVTATVSKYASAIGLRIADEVQR